MPALVCNLLQLYVYLLIGRVILSWFPVSPGSAMSSVYRFLLTITEPVLGPLRRAIPPVGLGGMGLDLSPIIALLGIQVIKGILCH